MEKENNPLTPATTNRSLPREFDYYDLEPESRRYPHDFFYILAKRKWWIIGTLLAVMAATLLIILFMTPVYKSATVLQITQDSTAPQIGESDNMSLLKASQEYSKFQETQYKILTSRGVAARVIEALNLRETPEFKAVAQEDPAASPEKVKSKMIDLFLDKLVVTPIKDTYLVEVAFKSEDRKLAKRVTDTLAQEYMQLVIDSRTESFALVKNWLGKQLQQMADKVQASQKKLFEFGQKHDFYALEDKDNVIIQKYIELSGLLTKAQSERMAKEALYRQIKEKGPDAPLVTNNPLIMNLRQELAAQTSKVSGLTRTLLPGHPEMQTARASLGELRGRLRSEVQRLQKTVQADYEAAVKAENLLTEALQNQKNKLSKLQNNLVDFQILKRDAQTSEKLYKALLERMGETTVASTMVAGNVAVIDPPETPYEPYLPQPPVFFLLAGVLGLFLGVGLAFFVEYMDTSIKTTDEVERVVQLPSLGMVPRYLDCHRKPSNGDLAGRVRGWLPWVDRTPPLPNRELDLMMLKHPRSAMSEAIRHLRTSLMLSVSEGPPEVIVVTSPHPREGKSTIATNLAIALAQDGRRVAILDCDLRKPRLHEVFEIDNHPGLTSYLAGNCSMADILKPTEVDNLFFIPAGPAPPNPAELLNSQAYNNLLQQLRRDFQHLIIDTPPTLGFADARVLALQADGVLLVAKHQGTSKEAGKLARQHFAQINAKMLGMVLNQVGTKDLRRYAHYHKCYEQYYADKQVETPALEHQDDFPSVHLN